MGGGINGPVLSLMERWCIMFKRWCIMERYRISFKELSVNIRGSQCSTAAMSHSSSRPALPSSSPLYLRT
ncbi:hypothetical protein CgunFtcFv8_024002 [Champsocephalus gunnari]|uniref:Uncharacterized protein n=1 Tax=Champsocephalus gunnari TaxID=52237 RepID=A0AAN8DDH1_CHAGU|nr:hypothetical protein CgunFtcFv8_024002 [Champsocephalus gunnari]